MTMFPIISPIGGKHEYVLEHVPVLHNEHVVSVGINSKHSGHILSWAGQVNAKSLRQYILVNLFFSYIQIKEAEWKEHMSDPLSPLL